MNMERKRNWTLGLFAALLSVPLTASADGVLHGRVSFDAGGTLVKGVEESDWSNATVNTLILPGDTVWVDNGGTAELEFSGGTFLRMADGSKAEIADLASGGAVRGWNGSFYVQRLSRSSGNFVFYTPAGIVDVEKDSSVRIDILDEGVTTVSTRWGRATIRTDAGGAVQAFAGKRVFVESGLLPSEPAPFDRSAEDAFDQWNRERAEFYATGSTQTPSSVKISQNTLGISDLDRYGEWVYVDNTPYWRPTAIVDYTPYRYGYWNNVYGVGNVWVGNYPFSYVTSHHGYWDYNSRYGWMWSYTPTWSPAWCATVRYGDYFVWAPVNRHYRPVYPTTSAYFSIGGVSFGYWGTSCARVDSLYYGPSYVNYAHYDGFRNYYGHGNVTVNIWNINSNGRQPQVRVPYNNSVTTVRDYTPRRRIRGASSFDNVSRSASERVQRLESANGRESFSRSSRTGSEFVRTASTSANNASRVRTARIDQSTPDYARASRGNPVRASSAVPRSNDGSSARGTASRGTTDRANVARGTTEHIDTTRGNTSGRTSATRSSSNRPSVTDSTSGRSSASRGSTGRTSTSRGSSDRSSVSRTTPQRTDVDPRSNSFDANPSVQTYTRTPSRTTSRGQEATAARTPSRESSTPARTSVDRSNDSPSSRATSSRTTTRSAVPQTTSAPSRTRTQVPSNAPTTSRAQTPSYQAPTRTSTPDRSSVPSRSVAPRESAPSRSVAPRQSVPSRSVAPSQSPAPRSVAPRQSAPSRVTAPSPAPSRSVSTPPSRSTSVRSPAPSPRSAPSSVNSRSGSRESTSNGRSVGSSRGR